MKKVLMDQDRICSARPPESTDQVENSSAISVQTNHDLSQAGMVFARCTKNAAMCCGVKYNSGFVYFWLQYNRPFD
jgi:hypothetical protein